MASGDGRGPIERADLGDVSPGLARLLLFLIEPPRGDWKEEVLRALDEPLFARRSNTEIQNPQRECGAGCVGCSTGGVFDD